MYAKREGKSLIILRMTFCFSQNEAVVPLYFYSDVQVLQIDFPLGLTLSETAGHG